MTTLSVKSYALSALLRDVREASAGDDTLPTIAGVLLHTARTEDGKTVLAGTATDRFMLLHGHSATDSGDLADPVFLNNAQVSQLLAMLRPYTTRRRVEFARTEITVNAGAVRFEQGQLDGDDLGAIGVTFAHNPGKKFPEFERLINAAREAEPSSDGCAIDGRLMVRIARIAGARHEAMRMRSHGMRKAALIQIGTNLLALAMPVRMDDKTAALDIPVYPVPVLDEAVAA